MSVRALEKRLAKIEKKLNDRVKRQKLPDCSCPAINVLWPDEQFDAARNRTCLLHGTILIRVRYEEPENPRLDELPAEYEARMAQLELADGSKES